MPTYEKRSGNWRARIIRKGVTRTATFPTKQHAVAWATRTEAEIIGAEYGEIPRHLTVKDLLERYAREVSAHKKGKKWEEVRIRLLQRDSLAAVRLRDLDATHLSTWQERRAKAIKSASVRRERNLLQNALSIGRKEWKWVKGNPFDGVRRPKDSRHRDRIATQDELDRLTAQTGGLSEIILWAVETGMRCKEIANLRDVRGNVAYVSDPKTGHDREVPLSTKAVGLWKGGWNLTAGSISTMFAGRCKALGIVGLKFHDLRHTACTRNAARLSILELCKMMGWKNPKFAMVYYNEATSKIAAKLG